MTVSRSGRLRNPVIIAYALPACVMALPTIPVYIHLPALYGVELGLGLATTGLILLVARLFDMVTDPVIGLLSDRYPFRGPDRWRGSPLCGRGYPTRETLRGSS